MTFDQDMTFSVSHAIQNWQVKLTSINKSLNQDLL